MFTVFLYAKPPKNAALKTRAAHVKKTIVKGATLYIPEKLIVFY